MKDQVDTLVGNGVPAGLYNSSLAADEKAAVVAGLRQGRYRLLYVSPERLVGEGSDGFLSLLSSCQVSFVAVDEAHCISQWGHDFRPEYRQLGRLRQLLPGVSLHAYTATATARVRRDIATQLAPERSARVRRLVRPAESPLPGAAEGGAEASTARGARPPSRRAGIIYCTSRREVDALAAWLTGLGTPALPYHAGLSDAERRRNQDAFLERTRRRHRRHGGLRHGHRPVERAVRRARRSPAIARALPAGVRTRGAGRPRGRVRADLLGRRLHEVAPDARARAASCPTPAGPFCGRWSATRPASAAAIGISPSISAIATRPSGRTRRAAARRATSASTSSSRWPHRSCSPARFCRASPASSSGSARRTWRACCADTPPNRCVARGHDKLSTFGLLPHASVAEVRGYIEQLTGLGLLQQAGDEYPVLALTPKGLALLKDATTCPDLTLARQRPPRQGRAARAVARRGRIVAGRRSRALRSPARRPARDRAVARRAART